MKFKPGDKAYYVRNESMFEIVVVQSSKVWTTYTHAWSFGRGRVRTKNLRPRDWTVASSRDGISR